MATASTIKDEARRIVDALPDDASWEDLIYRLYVHQAIEEGIKDAEAGNLVPTDEVKREFGLLE